VLQHDILASKTPLCDLPHIMFFFLCLPRCRVLNHLESQSEDVESV